MIVEKNVFFIENRIYFFLLKDKNRYETIFNNISFSKFSLNIKNTKKKK